MEEHSSRPEKGRGLDALSSMWLRTKDHREIWTLSGHPHPRQSQQGQRLGVGSLSQGCERTSLYQESLVGVGGRRWDGRRGEEKR